VSLPILTMDERLLSPRFGYVFQRRWLDPYESILGMLWKFARMNRMAGNALAAQLSAEPIDPYTGVRPTPTEIDVRRVARLLGLTQCSVRSALPWPGAATSPYIRYCPRCLVRGYHGVVHQVERHSQCLLHGLPLQVRCRHCDRTSDYRLDAQLLDSPFRCRHCRGHYASGPPRFLNRSPLKHQARVALTRAWVD
jgi:hypothetical protein